MTDARRQWVPISSTVAHGSTGTAILRKFGRDGLLVWILFLAACKREGIGSMTFTTEGEAWRLLGVDPADEPFEFTLGEFFAYTGQGLKLTTKSRSGRVTTVGVKPDVWKTWNRGVSRQRDGDRKRAERGKA